MFVFASCSSVKMLDNEKAEGANLSAYKSFDFYSVEASGDTVTQRFKDNITKLEDAITLELQKHGYLLSKTNPDLLVNIGVVVDEQIQTRQTDYATDAPTYIGQRHYSWKSEEVETGVFKEGTVTVDLVDRQQNKMVWTGTIQGVIPKKEANLQKNLSKGVAKLFSGLGKSSVNP
jgi:hypothetical protein